MKNKYISYAGIGARDTPKPFLKAMENVASYLAGEGLVLRSGAADGADAAFERGCDYNSGNKEIYLPWKKFKNHNSKFNTIGLAAYDVANKYHPNWGNLSEPVKKLIARNSYQLLGMNLDQPADFIICWTVNGKTFGGTGQAIRIAKDYKIPIFNMGRDSLPDIESNMLSLISKIKGKK